MGFIVTCLIFSCATSKKIPEGNSWLRIGSGGGFAGSVNAFHIYDNGVVTDGKNYLFKVKKNQVSQWKSNMKTLGIHDMVIDNPGNMYKFVEFFDGDGQQRRLVWGGRHDFNTKNLNLFYRNLNNIITKQSVND